MKSSAWTVLSLLLAGCAPDAHPPRGLPEPVHTSEPDTAAPARSSGPISGGVDASFAVQLEKLAPAPATVVHASAFDDAAPYGIVVAYRPSMGGQPATCEVIVVERRHGQPVVVESSAHLLQCSTIPAPDALRDALRIATGHDRIELRHSGSREEARFTLLRVAEGDWRIQGAHFSFAQDDPDTGVVQAVTESVRYQDHARMPRMSTYHYAGIKPDLTRTYVD